MKNSTSQMAEGALEHSMSSRGALTAAVLRARILEGIYPPGARLREIEVREEFGLSNGPVREAFQILAAEGLVEKAQWRGVRVTQLSERQIVELFQLRLALLQYTAEHAARHASDEMLDRGRQMLQRLTDAIDAARASEGRMRFTGEMSRWLIDAAGNEMIAEVWSNTVSRLHIYLNASARKSKGSRLKPYIADFITAITERRAADAREAARALTRQTLEDLGISEKL